MDPLRSISLLLCLAIRADHPGLSCILLHAPTGFVILPDMEKAARNAHYAEHHFAWIKRLMDGRL